MNLSKLTTEQILETYQFPHRFVVAFAVAVANDVKHLTNNKDALSALALAERFSLGEDIPSEQLKAAADKAYAAATSAAAYATSATYAAATSAAATAATSATYAATSATSATYAATKANKESQYRDLLIRMIDERFSALEKTLIGLT